MEFLLIFLLMILIYYFILNNFKKKLPRGKTFNNYNPVYVFFFVFFLVIWLYFGLRFATSLKTARNDFDISIFKLIFPQIRELMFELVLDFASVNDGDLATSLLMLLMSYNDFLLSFLALAISLWFLYIMTGRIVVSQDKLYFNKKNYGPKDIISYKTRTILGKKIVLIKFKDEELYLGPKEESDEIIRFIETSN